ncbi:MAG: helix-turn-helix domain-containing protein [bacterium]|jgi:transposase-like protein
MNRKKKHERKSPHEQIAIAREYLEGHDTQREVAARHGVDRASVAGYVMRYKRGEIRLIAPALQEAKSRVPVVLSGTALQAKLRRARKRGLVK